MLNQTDIEKLKRFTRGLSDPAEEKYIAGLFAGKENNREFRNQIRRDFDAWLKDHPEEDHQLAYLLDRIHHLIHKKEEAKRQTLSRKFYRWYSAAAAILLIPLLIAGGVWFMQQQQQAPVVAEAPVTSTLYAPLGSRISFSLPDGTRGWLNSGSSLEYQTPFSKNRQIALQGEAWFDVAHDEAHPFQVEAGKSTIRVLGTKFNLSAYPEENYVEVVLEEGKVTFAAPGMVRPVAVKPSERLVFTNDSIHIGFTDPLKYSAWVEGKLVFRNDPMAEVARRIERWYHVDVQLMDASLQSDIIRGTFEDDSLEDVLRYLSMSTPISYRIEDRQIRDDGTFSRKKVLLYREKRE